MATTKTTAKVSPVDTLILAAGKAAGTMYSKTIEAAGLAKLELNSDKTLAERIAAVVTAHAAAFTVAGHNVKAIFVDALTLHACAGDQVVIAGPKNSTQTVSAAKAVTMAKNPMREAAKEVRAKHGMGRKVTPKVVTTAPKATQAQEDANVSRETLDNVADLIENVDFIARLTTLLDAAGYVLAPKAKRANAAKSTPKVRVNMADVPAHKITGAVNQPAPM